MTAVQNYSSLASHAGGSLYALQDGRIIEFAVQSRNLSQWLTQGHSVSP